MVLKSPKTIPAIMPISTVKMETAIITSIKVNPVREFSLTKCIFSNGVKPFLQIFKPEIFMPLLLLVIILSYI